MRVGLPVPIKSFDDTLDELRSPVLQENYNFEDLMEEEDESDIIAEYDERASTILRDLDALHNSVQNFYSDLRAQKLPFFGFNELHDASKKFDNTLHRAVDLLMKTRNALKKHMD